MVDERLDGRVVQVGVGGVDGVPGVGAHAGRAGQEGLEAVTADAQDPGQAPQERLEEGAARPGAGVRADLLVVEGDQDDGLGGLGPGDRERLEGDQSGVDGGEVVQAGGGQELSVAAEAGGRLGGVGQDVVADELGRIDAGDLAQVGLDGVGGGIGSGQRPQGQQVGLAVQVEGVVDAAVQVRGDLGHAGDGAGAHEVDGAVAGGQASGQAQLAVEEGGEQGAAVDLGVDELPAGADEGGGGLELEGRGVGVGADDAQAHPRVECLGQSPGGDGAVADDVAAPRQVLLPGDGLVGTGEAGLLQAAGDLGGGVVGAGRGRDEVDERVGVGVVVAQDRGSVTGGGAGSISHGPSLPPVRPTPRPTSRAKLTAR